MAKAASRSKKTSKKKKSQQIDFEIFVPLVKRGNAELPVLNPFNHCIVFTARHRLSRWREFYTIEISSVKRYKSISSLPRMIKILMLGKRPKGLNVDPNPVTSNHYSLEFISKANDYGLTDDIERMVEFIKGVWNQTNKLDPKPENA